MFHNSINIFLCLSYFMWIIFILNWDYPHTILYILYSHLPFLQFLIYAWFHVLFPCQRLLYPSGVIFTSRTHLIVWTKSQTHHGYLYNNARSHSPPFSTGQDIGDYSSLWTAKELLVARSKRVVSLLAYQLPRDIQEEVKAEVVEIDDDLRHSDSHKLLFPLRRS